MTDLHWQAESVALADLHPHPRNYRTHPAAQLAHLARSLQDHGFYRNIVIARDGTILAGHGVVDAARSIGKTVAPVIRLDLDADDPRALKVLIGDNQIGQLAAIDDGELTDLLQAIQLSDLADLVGTGYDAQQLAALVATHRPTVGQTEPDAVPASRATAIQRGDLFALGRHRLLCGDSFDPADRSRLMQDAVAAFVFGDPPYGIALDDATAARRIGFYGGTAISDTTAPWDATLRADWITGWADVVAPAGYLASWTPYQGIGPVATAALTAGLHWLNLYTWVKPNPPPGFPEYLAKSTEHAAIFRRDGKGRYIGPELVRDYIVQPTVTGDERMDHPSPKPVGVVEPVIQKLTPPGALVVDPFIGSGTLVIVCERLGRRCYAIDIDPAYCQATIDRWEAFTGARATPVDATVRAT